jgi:hypothetical protein
MDYEPVALQAGKVRSHSVVGQAQLFCEFVYRPISCAQEVQDSPSRTFEQPLPPTYMFHYVMIMGIRSKSKEWLTNFCQRLDESRDSLTG